MSEVIVGKMRNRHVKSAEAPVQEKRMTGASKGAMTAFITGCSQRAYNELAEAVAHNWNYSLRSDDMPRQKLQLKSLR